jgi:formylglycine-generating enzyme required for sulfatase activity
MGSNSGNSDEIPVHSVTIANSFYLGKCEVTQKEWSVIMGNNPSSGDGVGDNYPVYNVSWYSTLVYCYLRSLQEGFTPCYRINNSSDTANWGVVPTVSDSLWNSVECDFSANGFRLPTEAEWEYAARYNDSRTYPWGETTPSSTLCNYNYNSDYMTKSSKIVDSYPNGNSQLAFSDLAGNCDEWVWDWYGPYSIDNQTNPVGPTTGTYRILRGGCWYSGETNLRCTNRSSKQLPYLPGINWSDGAKTAGFRIARTN